MKTWQFLYFLFNKYIKFKNWTYWSFYLYERFETGGFETRRFETWHFVNLTFCKPDVLPDILKQDILQPDVLKPYVLWVYHIKYLNSFSFCVKSGAEKHVLTYSLARPQGSRCPWRKGTLLFPISCLLLHFLIRKIFLFLHYDHLLLFQI